MRAVVYCRVSTKEQVESLSLPTQQRACEDYCRREGWEVAKVFVEEGESAKTADRTELKRLLAFCRENKRTVGVVVVYNLSRFSRNAGDHQALRGMLAALGVVLKSATEPITDDPTGRFMETILSAVAQLDNDVKADRTRAGMRSALALGRWTWQPPYGYARGQRGGPSMVLDPVHAAPVRRAFVEFADGTPKTDVLARLLAAGAAERRGGPRRLKDLDRMLRNPLYAGRVEVAKWRIASAGDFEVLVPEETFDRVQARLRGRLGRAVKYAKDNPDFPLRRFVRCGECESQGLTGAWTQVKTRRYGYYQCRVCGLRVSKPDLEGAFVHLLARLQPRPEYLRLFRVVVLDVWRGRTAGAREERERRERQVRTHRAKLDRIADLVSDGTLDAEDYTRQRDRLREQVAVAEAELADAVVEHLDVDAVLAFAESVLADASRLWEQASPEDKRRLQAAFFPEGLVWEACGKIRNSATASAFTDLRLFARPKSRLASPTGFEPVSPP